MSFFSRYSFILDNLCHERGICIYPAVLRDLGSSQFYLFNIRIEQGICICLLLFQFHSALCHSFALSQFQFSSSLFRKKIEIFMLTMIFFQKSFNFAQLLNFERLNNNVGMKRTIKVNVPFRNKISK